MTSSDPLESTKPDDGIARMGEALAHAWQRYTQLFGVVPHGSCRQLAAMLQLCPEAKEAVRLWDEQRIEKETA